jgi:hypothetical protein
VGFGSFGWLVDIFIEFFDGLDYLTLSVATINVHILRMVEAHHFNIINKLGFKGFSSLNCK